MNITNETKAKVFAQYLGHNIYWQAIIGTLNAHNLVGASSPIEDARLLLKPLSAISDEDALDVAKFLWPNNTEYQKAYDGKYYVDNLFNEDFEMYSPNSITIYQILQSKGYDLPNYLLGGKTLHEAGLAIYETQK